MKSVTSVFIDHTIDQSDKVKQLIEKEGTVILRNLIDDAQAQRLKRELINALDEDKRKHGETYLFNGMVHALMNRGGAFIELLSMPTLLSIYRAILGHGCIVHAYNSSSMPPNKTNYSRSIHVDSPRLIPGYISNLGFTLAVDSFTSFNGAMEIYPDSFTQKEAPSEESFKREMVILNDMKVGDALLFNARCWHRGGVNSTQEWRHGITMNICRSFMRQQFDYCKMLGEDRLRKMTPDLQKVMGYNVRMPESMEDFLLPADERKYKPGQE